MPLNSQAFSTKPRDLVLLFTGAVSVLVALVALATYIAQHMTGFAVLGARLPVYCVLGLAISGTSLTLAGLGRMRLVQVGGVAALALAAALLVMKLAGDGRLVSHPVLSIHGIFGTSVVLCLTVMGGALVLMGMTVRLRQRPLMLGFLGAILIALPLSQLGGYLLGIGSDARSEFFVTFLLTAPTHLLAAWAILTFGWYDAASEQMQTQPVIPMLLIVGVLSGTLLLWQVLSTQSGGQLDEQIRIRAESIASEIEEGIDRHLRPPLELFPYGTGHGNETFRRFLGQLLVDHLEGLEALEVIDKNNATVWSVTDVGVPRSIIPDTRRSALTARAIQSQQPALSGFIRTRDGGTRLVFAIPLDKPGKANRILFATYNVDLLFHHLLHDPLPRNVVITVFDRFEDSTRPAYVLAEGTPAGRRWAQEVPLKFFGADWLLRVTPNTELVAGARSPLPEVVLFAGLSLTLAFVWVHYLARMATLRVDELALEVTRRQRAEHELQTLNEELEQRVRRRTEELYAANDIIAYEKDRLAVTLESIGDGVITTDTEARIQSMNPVAERLTGWNESEARGQTLDAVFRLVDPDTGKPIAGPIKEALEQRKMTEHAVSRLVAHNGEERLVAASAAPLHTEHEMIGAVLAFRDITQARRMEEELFKAKNLESIGLLAGGIAHDFNNLLTAIWGNIALAKLHAQPGDVIHDSLSEAEKAFGRARDLTLQLLTFSKGGAPLKAAASIADLLRDTTGFVLRGSNARAEFTLPDDLWPVAIDYGQISQAVNNLLINAKQAMPEGGTITVAAENTEIAKGHKFMEAGRYVKIAITDRGHGIPAEHLSRIFEPYFTTKDTGSGLGLAITYSIIKKHQGHIEVESEVGVGTRFHIYLPAARSARVLRPAKASAMPHGHGRILLMDDEEAIRRVAEKMLEALGYDVAVANDGEQAIALYREALREGKPFAAVVLDLTVPGGMGGEECARRLRALDPHAHTVVSSGYSNNPVIADYAKHGFDAVVAKPYQLGDLATVLARVIGGPGADKS